MQHFFSVFDADLNRIGLLPQYNGAYTIDNTTSCADFVYADVDRDNVFGGGTSTGPDPGLLAASIIVPSLVIIGIIICIICYVRHQNMREHKRI